MSSAIDTSVTKSAAMMVVSDANAAAVPFSNVSEVSNTRKSSSETHFYTADSEDMPDNVSDIDEIDGKGSPDAAEALSNEITPSETPDQSTDQTKEPTQSAVAEKRPAVELHPSDFYFGVTLGEGAFARVVHAKSKRTAEEFAVKIMEKLHIKKENKVKQVMTERAILAMISHPFLIKFHFSFQDAGYLYLCTELAPGGELTHLIDQKATEKLTMGVQDEACDYPTTQFYIGEIIEALEYLHTHKIIHRDLKPENVLLSHSGHVKVTDFGTSCRVVDNENSSSSSNSAGAGAGGGSAGSDSPRTSFVGTQDYVSPEVLSGESRATKACDLWAVGCMVYQMLTGISPFRQPTEYLTFEAISGHCKGTKPLQFPATINDTARDLIQSLLLREERQRLGAAEENEEGGNGYSALKQHSFFEGLQWGALSQMEALYQPDPEQFPSSDYMRDGAQDDWWFEGEATPILSKHHYNSDGECDEIDALGADNDDDEDIKAMIGNAAAVTLVKRRGSANARFDQFLRPEEQRIFTGLVYKRKGLFSKKRQLILTSTPRLIYLDPESMELKGEIPWTKEYPVSCVVKSQKDFDVICSSSGRAYHLSDAATGSKMWVDLINAMLQQQQQPEQQQQQQQQRIVDDIQSRYTPQQEKTDSISKNESKEALRESSETVDCDSGSATSVPTSAAASEVTEPSNTEKNAAEKDGLIAAANADRSHDVATPPTESSVEER